MNRILSLVVGTVLLTGVMTQESRAGLIVTGIETAPGAYSLTFSQDATVDAIQDSLFPFLGVSFNIDSLTLPISSIPNPPTGILADGTNTLIAGFGSWGGSAGLSFDPNLVTSPLSGVSFNSAISLAATGDDFSTITVGWNFGSMEGLSGSIQQGDVNPGVVPEPTSFAIFFAGLIGTAGIRRRRSAS